MVLPKKKKSNLETYSKVMSSYKIRKCLSCDIEKVDMDSYDVVIVVKGTEYASQKYTVVKNAPSLPEDVLALICDDGNLCFGYRAPGFGYYDRRGTIIIHTD